MMSAEVCFVLVIWTLSSVSGLCGQRRKEKKEGRHTQIHSRLLHIFEVIVLLGCHDGKC